MCQSQQELLLRHFSFCELGASNSDCGHEFQHLKGDGEPLRLLSSMRTLISSLAGNDTALAMEVSQIYRTTNVKVLRNDQTFMESHWRHSSLEI